ncbi:MULTISPECIES: hypothetical protein [Acinetobacter]|uniref:hypothetical protein n=1 Tax=Acinetobacter TaxID=469 RepID=UPI00068F2C85|nr:MULTISPECIES: hypothetical protein [unclassified Acinetobacter]WEE37793.1 hypothetical protein PYV58_12620 [Acinetobacter sp. TAC-1]
MGNEKKVPKMVRKSSEIFGVIAPTFLAEPTGLLSLLITSTGDLIADSLDKKLSEREALRTNMAYQYFVDRLKQHQDNGLVIRDDDFFRFSVGVRKPFEELFEAVLIKSKDQYEEEKVKFFSNLYANGCVDTTLSPQMISLFILILDRLSFNHLDILNRFEILGLESLWQSNDVYTLQDQNPLLPTYIEELKNLNLITPTFWGDSPLKITNLGKKLIKSIEFNNIFDLPHNHCISKNNPVR